MAERDESWSQELPHNDKIVRWCVFVQKRPTVWLSVLRTNDVYSGHETLQHFQITTSSDSSTFRNQLLVNNVTGIEESDEHLSWFSTSAAAPFMASMMMVFSRPNFATLWGPYFAGLKVPYFAARLNWRLCLLLQSCLCNVQLLHLFDHHSENYAQNFHFFLNLPYILIFYNLINTLIILESLSTHYRKMLFYCFFANFGCTILRFAGPMSRGIGELD